MPQNRDEKAVNVSYSIYILSRQCYENRLKGLVHVSSDALTCI